MNLQLFLFPLTHNASSILSLNRIFYHSTKVMANLRVATLFNGEEHNLIIDMIKQTVLYTHIDDKLNNY